MSTTLKQLCLFSCFCLLIFCRKAKTDYLPVFNAGNKITADVSGKIVDQGGNPVQGALVTAGNNTTTTDVSGKFTIRNSTFFENAAFVKIEKQGFFPGSRTFFARQGQMHYVSIELLTRNNVGSINASAGGTLTFNTASITLPANSIVTENTKAIYNGTVKVFGTWIDPTGENLHKQMPGDLRGIDANNMEQGLTTYGMLGIELEGTNGEKLQIASGQKAKLKFPLPTTLQSSAPTTIPLWFFDELTGLWKEEGKATKVGTNYEGEVAHFSFWNCDISGPVVDFKARFIDNNNQPVANAWVSIEGNGTYVHGTTDSTGFAQGKIPANQNLVLKIYSDAICAVLLYTQSIGPSNTAVDLGTINIGTVPAINAFTLTGIAKNCTGSNITDGYIDVIGDGIGHFRSLITSGSFSISFNHCKPSPAITYFIADNTTNQQSNPVQIAATPGTTNVGVIQACGLSMDRYININFNGTNYNFSSPLDSTFSEGRWLALDCYAAKPGGAQSVSFVIASMNMTPDTACNIGSFRLKIPGFNGTLGYNYPYPYNATITEYGPIGGYVSGHFAYMFTSPSTGTTVHNVQGNFRLRRTIY